MSFQRDFLSRRISDPLAKIVSDLAKEEYAQNFQIQNIDTLNVQVISVKARTKSNSKDKYHISTKTYAENQHFFNAVIPDYDDCRLWLKGENSDKLRDYSLRNNEAYLWSDYQVAEIYPRDSPNNMAKHEIVSYMNGTHYVRVVDHPLFRLTDIVTNETEKEGFTILTRFNPLKWGKSHQNSVILEQKIDSSQNRYGHSINIDERGNIYFYVKYNYRQYFCKLDNFIPEELSFIANFRMENFKEENFKTETYIIENRSQFDYDLAARFDFTTKECSLTVLKDGVLLAYSSSLSGVNALPNDLQLHLPLQEGKWSETQALPDNVPLNQVFDSSSNGVAGTINNLPTGGIWNDDNTLTSLGLSSSNISITFPSISAINSITEFTLAFWFNPLDELVRPASTGYLLQKGFGDANSFLMFRGASANSLGFNLYDNSGTLTQLIFPNAFPTADTWYFVVAKWKSGEKMKLYINNVKVESSTSPSLTLGTQDFQLFRTTGCAKGNIINFMFFNRQINDTEQTTVYNYGAHLAQFPKNLEPQRLPDPDPEPITNPLITIYDHPKPTTPVTGDYVYLNLPQLTSDFVSVYNCPMGTSEEIPFSSIYNIALGATSAADPLTDIYNHTDSGFEIIELDGETNLLVVGAKVAGSMVGKKLTEFTYHISSNASSIEGTIYGRVWASGSGKTIRKTFPQTFNPPTESDGWIDVKFYDYASTMTLNSGDRVGIEWSSPSGGTDEVYVQVDTDSSNNGSAGTNTGATLDWWDGSWHNDSTGAPVANMKTGSDAAAPANPYIALTVESINSVLYAGQRFHSTSTSVLNKPATKIDVFMYRESVTSGTVSCVVFDTNWNIKATLETKSYSVLPTAGGTKVTFTNLNNTYSTQPGDVIGFTRTGVNSGGKIWIGYNLNNTGGGNSYDGTNAYVRYYEQPFFTSGGTKTIAANDISMEIWTGGTTFLAYKRFSASVTKIYERCVNTSSGLYDKAISQAQFNIQRIGTIAEPSTLFCYMRNLANDDKVLLGTIDANSIDTADYELITFTKNNQAIKMAVGDYISLEIDSCTATNYLQVNMNKNVIGADNTIAGVIDNDTVNDLASFDVSGQFYTGGDIDLTSRTRVGQYIKDQNSLFMTVESNKVTVIEWYLTKNGSPSGLIHFCIRRAGDDSIIKEFGTYASSGITGTIASPTLVHIEDFSNTYSFEVGDKLTVEYEGGDSSNQVGVLTRTSSPNYDLDHSQVTKYNGVSYEFDPTRDVVATFKVGGNTYTPEPNAAPPVLPENSTDLYIFNNGELLPDKFEKGIFNQYLFFTKILTDDELINFNYNRIDIGEHDLGEIQVTNHSFIRNAT